MATGSFKQIGVSSRGKGFSLLEMMIVILVIGILYSLAGSFLGVSMSDPLNAELDRLQAHVQLAQDESIVRSQAAALGFDKTGYAFFWQDDTGEWKLAEKDRLFGQHAFSDASFTPRLFLSGQEVVLPAADKVRPQVFILPTGEMMPFEWQLAASPARKGVVKFNANGLIEAPASASGG